MMMVHTTLIMIEQAGYLPKGGSIKIITTVGAKDFRMQQCKLVKYKVWCLMAFQLLLLLLIMN